MIDLSEVQSLIVRPRAASQVDIAFLRCSTRSELIEVLAAVADVVDVGQGSDPTRPALNIALTVQGVALAGADDRTLAAMSPAFVAGMRAAAGRLGDEEASGPDHWVAPFATGSPAVHLALLGIGPQATDPEGDPDERVPSDWCGLEAAVDEHGVATWSGQRRSGGREPFGFRDGISTPVIQGTGLAMAPGNGVWDDVARSWRPVRAGEALLGHVDEGGAVSGRRDAAWLERGGSYLVLRRLQQHTQAFRDSCQAVGDRFGLRPEEVAASIVGRRCDGSALGQTAGEAPDNDFLYRDGSPPRERAAPSSHIRRSNPRDDIEAAASTVPRHMMFRRGLPYGPEEDDGEEGLLFMVVCADIRRQFEFVQSRWLQDGNRFGLGHERDGLTGQRPAEGSPQPPPTKVSIADSNGERLVQGGMPQFVTTRGGEYLFLPSRSALGRLAGPGRR